MTTKNNGTLHETQSDGYFTWRLRVMGTLHED
jgi:hypothetical protein